MMNTIKNRIGLFNFWLTNALLLMSLSFSQVSNASNNLSSNDPFSQEQWGLHNRGQNQDIELDLTTVYQVPGRAGEDIGLTGGSGSENLKKAKKKTLIAVLDTGIDHSHEDLKGSIHRNESECKALQKFLKCVADTKDTDVQTGRAICEAKWFDLNNPEVDQDKNGYPLDCEGWSVPTTGQVNNIGIMGQPDFFDSMGHGTHVAGIIAAQRNNKIGVAGASSNVEILPVQVLSANPTEPIKPLSVNLPTDLPVSNLNLNSEFQIPQALLPTEALAGANINSNAVSSDSNPSALNLQIMPPSLFDAVIDPNAPIPFDLSPIEHGSATASLGDFVARGVIYAINSGAQVITFSLGWPQAVDSEYLRQAIAEAQRRGIIVIAAAGNDSTRSLLRPCVYPGVICVGSHGPDGSLSHFSNYGSGVDVAAPGTNILSTWPMDILPVRFKNKFGYEYLSGTSQATPFVAAIVGEMLAQGVPANEIYPRLILGASALKSKLPIQYGAINNLQTDKDSNADVRNNVEQKWILSGRVDLENSLNVKSQALILPDNKEIQEIIWDRKSDELTATFSFKNFWQDIDSSSVSISGSFLKPNKKSIRPVIISMNFSENDLNWKMGQTRHLVVKMKIVDNKIPAQSKIPSELSIVVNVKTPERVQKYVLESEIVVPVGPQFSSPGMEILPLADAIPEGANLVSVDKNKDQSTATDYVAIADKEGVRSYYLFKQASDGQYHLANANKPLTVDLAEDNEASRELLIARMPWDFSRKESGYVIAIARLHQDPEDFSAPPTYSKLLIYYTDANMNIVKQQEVANENVILPAPGQLVWMRGESSLTPAWYANGKPTKIIHTALGDWQNPNGSLEREDIKFRLYYFTEKNELSSIDKFTDKLTDKLNEKDQEYRIAGTLQATLEQTMQGIVPLLLMKNHGTELKPSDISDFAIADFSQGQVRNLQLLPMDSSNYRNLFRLPMAESMNLDLSFDVTGKATFWYAKGPNRSQRLTIFSRTKDGPGLYNAYLKPSRGIVDAALLVRGSYSGSEGYGAFVLTNSELQYHDISRNQTLTTSLERYTFYDDLAFTATRFPVVLQDSLKPQRLIPAVYSVENLGMSRGIKFKAAVRDEQNNLLEMISPAKLRFKTEMGCRSLSNLTRTKDGAPAIDYYCGKKILRMRLAY